MNPTLRNRLIAVGALLAAGAALAFIALGNIGNNLVYYWTPTEVLANGENAYGPTIRMGGMVKAGSVNWDKDRTHLSFAVADGTAADAKVVSVVSTEIPPQMFREGIGVVVEGTYDRSGTFTSSRLMVNHSNEYRAPKPGEDPKKEWERTLDSEPTTASARPQ